MNEVILPVAMISIYNGMKLIFFCDVHEMKWNEKRTHKQQPISQNNVKSKCWSERNVHLHTLASIDDRKQ